MHTRGTDNNLHNRSHRSFGTHIREIHENGPRPRGYGRIQGVRDDIQGQLALEEIAIQPPTQNSEGPYPISKFPLPG